MHESDFNQDASQQNLHRREMAKAAAREEHRLKLLQKTLEVLHKELQGQNVEVWLIGSITQPNKFSERSDVDIVVKNFFGDRFDLWTLVERQIGHDIEIIRFEECGFQNEIISKGMKVV